MNILNKKKGIQDMKTGIRKPNVKKSISARTTGKVKRAVKKSVNPLYGKKGAGFVKDPAKSIENSIYHKTTIGVSDIISGSGSSSPAAASSPAARSAYSGKDPAAAPEKKKGGVLSIILIVIGVLFLIGGINGFSIAVSNGIFGLVVGGVLLFFGIRIRRRRNNEE
jgi:hypothetical protein